MSTSPPPRSRSGAFEIETESSKRLLEFDPDVIRGRDVRILVDGKRVAELPYPKPATPYQEVAFELEGHALMGATRLPLESWPAGLPLEYDVFVDGRSLTDGSSLVEFREGAPAPGAPYPKSFSLIEVTLRIVPVAAGPGIVGGLARNVDSLGWQRTIGALASMLVAVGLGSAAGAGIWRRVRANEEQSVRRRAVLGWITVLTCYAIALGAVIVLAVLGSGRS